MSKKLLSMVLCVTMILSMVSFTGCSKKSDKKKGDITFMFWDEFDTSKDLMTKGYAETIERFNKDYEGTYHVTVVTTKLADYTTKLNAKISAGECPDIFICNPGPNLTAYVEQGQAADLTSILNDSEKAWGDTFTKALFNRITYDGKIMAVPTNFAASCVYYNTELFEKAGVTPPQTFDELLTVCDKLKKSGIIPLTVSIKDAWCLSQIAGYLCDRQGGPTNLDNIKNNTGKWTDKSFIDAGTKLAELSQYFQDTAKGDSNDQSTANFYNGKAAMLIQGSWAIGQMNGTVPEIEDKCGVFQFPSIENGSDPNRLTVKTDNLVMSSTTEEKDGVIALMKYFTDDTAQKYTAEIAGKIPVTTTCEIDYNKAPKQLSYINEILKNMTGDFGFYNESLASVEAGDIFDNAMVSIALKEVTPEEGFQKVQDFYEKNVWK